MEAESSCCCCGSGCGQPGSSAMHQPAPVARNARAYSRLRHCSACCSTHPGCPQRTTPHPYRPCQTPPPALTITRSDHCTSQLPLLLPTLQRRTGGHIVWRRRRRRRAASVHPAGWPAGLHKQPAVEPGSCLQCGGAPDHNCAGAASAGGAASWRQRPRAAAGRACRGALTTIDSPFLTLSPGDLSQDTILPSARASTK